MQYVQVERNGRCRSSHGMIARCLRQTRGESHHRIYPSARVSSSTCISAVTTDTQPYPTNSIPEEKRNALKVRGIREYDINEYPILWWSRDTCVYTRRKSTSHNSYTGQLYRFFSTYCDRSHIRVTHYVTRITSTICIYLISLCEDK